MSTEAKGGTASEVDRVPDSFEAFVASLVFVSVETLHVAAERTGAGEWSGSDSSLQSSVAVDPTQDAVFYRFDQAVRVLAEHDEQIGQIDVKLVLVFATPSASAPREYLERFGAGPALMMAYPYLREAVTSMGARIGAHGLLLPIIRPNG